MAIKTVFFFLSKWGQRALCSCSAVMYLYFVAGENFKPRWAGTNIRKTKGTHIRTEMNVNRFNKKNIRTAYTNNIAQLPLINWQTRKVFVAFCCLFSNMQRNNYVHPNYCIRHSYAEHSTAHNIALLGFLLLHIFCLLFNIYCTSCSKRIRLQMLNLRRCRKVNKL